MQLKDTVEMKYESTYRKLINANIPFYIKKVQYKKVKVIEIEKFWSWAEKNKVYN